MMMGTYGALRAVLAAILSNDQTQAFVLALAQRGSDILTFRLIAPVHYPAGPARKPWTAIGKSVLHTCCVWAAPAAVVTTLAALAVS